MFFVGLFVCFSFFLIIVFININIITSIAGVVVMFYFVSIIKPFLSQPMSCDGGFFWLVGFVLILIFFSLFSLPSYCWCSGEEVSEQLHKT